MALIQIDEDIEKQILDRVKDCVGPLEKEHIIGLDYVEKRRTESKIPFFAIDGTWQFTLDVNAIQRIEKMTHSEFGFVCGRDSDKPGFTAYFYLRQGRGKSKKELAN